jgi:2-C-methyl-D-erythritol 4-phosphate cytidylyltransferase
VSGPIVAAAEVVGIIAAAGSGERLGGEIPKALVDCGGRAMLEWSVAPLAATCDRVIAALPRGVDEHRTGTLAAVEVVVGGASRSESVAAAARAAPAAGAYVVHDAARPLVTTNLVERCLAELDAWDAAIAAAPVKDTVKEVGDDGSVLRTLDRSSLWAVQTPQAFRGEPLRRALDVDADRLAAATDDAVLVEAAGGRVKVVPAPPDNLKVTTRADLATAEALLAARGD